MSKLFSALIGLSMLGLVSAASAAEPVTLSDAQMDSVAAGQTTQNNQGIGQVALIPITVGALGAIQNVGVIASQQ